MLCIVNSNTLPSIMKGEFLHMYISGVSFLLCMPRETLGVSLLLSMPLERGNLQGPRALYR